MLNETMETRTESRPETYVPPKTLEECEHRLQNLLDDREAIQAQLGTRPRSGTKHETWRTRAKMALFYKTKEYRTLKTWKRDFNRETVLGRFTTKPNPNDPLSLLTALHAVLYDLHTCDIRLDNDALEIMNMTKNYLKQQGRKS
jgi:hypothetical protein